ncbi:WXG100 family type VII secretion target [Alkalicoccobacillus porphyridii]|uniref:WXG100 family type VII secretion target n=1 Tax=Alkalicoccobacillus porphyridii TaxID=2597270 RepID=A0A554A490_9BACI|nr:hypothetical protein [Alkalicoccobacillus porphyridii]TSB48509.1 hypothetical protein FN960_02855 [Alkalicoccobacillus porphyridii]
MTLRIQVDPDAVKSLVDKARQVPSGRVNTALDKLASLKEATSTWKGNAPGDHDAAIQELEKVITNSKVLMEAILVAMDQAVDNFEQIDEEISSKFEIMASQYTSEN